MTTYDIELRPPGATIAGFPGQVRTVRVEPWPDDYLDGRTFQWHLLRAGKTTDPVVIDTTADGTSLIAELTIPQLAGSWTLTLYEVVAEDHYEVRMRHELLSSRSAAPDATDITFGPVTVDDGDIVFELNVTLVEVTGDEGGGVTDHGDLDGLEDDDHPQYLTEGRGDLRYDELGAADDAQTAAAADATAKVAAEATARNNADTALDGRLDALEVAPVPHAATHADGGSDELALSGEQITSGTVAEARVAAAIARLANPNLTGNPTAPTQAPGSNNTRLATTEFVTAAIAALGDSAPDLLNTLNELAAALGDDPNFATTITNLIAAKLDGSALSDAAYDATAWNGDTTHVASKNAIRDLIEQLVGVTLPGTYVPQDLSSLTGSSVPDADDLVYIWLDGAPRKVALSDLAALILANAVLTGTVTVPDGALAIADTSGLQTALDGKQPIDSDLTAIAAIAPSNDDVVQRKAGAWVNRTMAQLIADLAALGTTFQPLDGDLTALAGLTSAANKGIQFTGSGTAATYDLTTAGKALLDDADAAAQRTTLGLGTMATATATDYVAKALFDANSILIATSDDTPLALTVAASRVLGRKSSGDIDDLTGAETAAILAGEVFKQAQEVNAQTGTTYTLVAGDAGKLVTLSNASAITLTLPQDSDATIAVGTYVDLYQLGAGQVTVAAGTGATLRTSGLTAKARAQYARLGVQKVSANTWSLFGDLAAS